MTHIPSATYRLQFNPAFGFAKAGEILVYLSDLGVSDLYASPVFKAKKGSMHCYDVVDPNVVNPDLGGEEALDALFRKVKSRKMGWLQDIVPNHMAFDGENEMLMDVLENGPDSAFSEYFDIEWEHPYETIRGRLLAPFLGRYYAVALHEGEIRLSFDERGYSINYYDLKLPLRIDSYGGLFTHKLASLKRKLGRDDPDYIKLLGTLYVLKNLPDKREMEERYDQIRFAKGVLWELYTRNEAIRNAMEEILDLYNGVKGNPESFNLMDQLLAGQRFRLSFWKLATEEINYRRFFNINGLVSMRVEHPHVFRKTHSLIFKLLEEGKITGLRVDHIDGLYDPLTYMKKLREKAGNVYMVVEKVLDFGEEMPGGWPVQGTTGYSFMNMVSGLFCQKGNARSFEKVYSKFANLKFTYEELLYEKKKLIIEKWMMGDVDNLAHQMKATLAKDRHGNDITLYSLKEGIVELLAYFPVYRTYADGEGPRESDRLYVREAMEKARNRNPSLLYEIDFIGRFLLLDFQDYVTEEERSAWIRIVMRFQQFSGPLMAKGFEDTLLYVYNNLLSLNEVGGFPDRFGVSLFEFHDYCEKRQKDWPHSLSASSTHDTKRGEDARARLNVLSELPQEWGRMIRLWSKINHAKKKIIGGAPVPDRNDEYFLYQTLIGAFPFREEEHEDYRNRISEYLIKAVREAKVHTGWLKPDLEYEETFISFVQRLLASSPKNRFIKEFLPFQKKIAFYGTFNSLSQTLIKITAPGVPDFYQGSELWELSLVDPDNRRPVDYAKRKRIQEEILEREGRDRSLLLQELLDTREDGRIKFFLIVMSLRCRKKLRSVFQKGSYLPLTVGGRHKDHVVAFARNLRDAWSVTVVPRFLAGIVKEGELPLGSKVWEDTHLILPEDAPASWTEIFSGEGLKGKEKIIVGEVLHSFPVGLLVSLPEAA